VPKSQGQSKYMTFKAGHMSIVQALTSPVGWLNSEFSANIVYWQAELQVKIEFMYL